MASPVANVQTCFCIAMHAGSLVFDLSCAESRRMRRPIVCQVVGDSDFRDFQRFENRLRAATSQQPHAVIVSIISAQTSNEVCRVRVRSPARRSEANSIRGRIRRCVRAGGHAQTMLAVGIRGHLISGDFNPRACQLVFEAMPASAPQRRRISLWYSNASSAPNTCVFQNSGARPKSESTSVLGSQNI